MFTSYRLKQLHEENVVLRKETGRLAVKDPSKLNIIAVPTYEDLTWRWRVYVPQGKGEQICLSSYQIPLTGYSGSFSSTTLPPGNYLLTATIRRNRHGDWALSVGHAGGTNMTNIIKTSADGDRRAFRGVGCIEARPGVRGRFLHREAFASTLWRLQDARAPVNGWMSSRVKAAPKMASCAPASFGKLAALAGGRGDVRPQRR